MRLNFFRGVFSAGSGLVLTGGGSVAVAPAGSAVSIIGWLGIVVGLGVFLWGLMVNDRHWWSYLLDRKGVPVQMPLRSLVRRVALHTEWGLAFESTHSPTWQDELKREILHKLGKGEVPAWGIKKLPGQPADSAPSAIPVGFWPEADFNPIHMLIDNEVGMVWHKRDPCEVLYTEVSFSRPAVDRVWPRISKRRHGGRISAFAPLAREWFDAQEDVRLNRNPGAGFDIAFQEGAIEDRLTRAATERARYEARKLGGMMDPVAIGAQLLDQDAKEAAKEAKKDRRRALIAGGRDVVARFRAEQPSDPFETWARRQREYLDIQPHLGAEYDRWVVRNADRDSSLADGEFLRELVRLEKEWDL
jgi:hypothetical protein